MALDSVRVNNQTAAVSATYAIIDSGTTALVLTTSDAAAINQVISGLRPINKWEGILAKCPYSSNLAHATSKTSLSWMSLLASSDVRSPRSNPANPARVDEAWEAIMEKCAWLVL